jgi:hypothetical protein
MASAAFQSRNAAFFPRHPAPMAFESVSPLDALWKE